MHRLGIVASAAGLIAFFVSMIALTDRAMVIGMIVSFTATVAGMVVGNEKSTHHCEW